MDPLTDKGRATRDRILATAVELFRRDGYEATTLRAIAKEAGVSPGLAYRYVESKDALVLGLYAQLAAEFDRRMEDLPDGSWTERTAAALDASFEVLAPHRETLGALLSTMLTPRGDVIWVPWAESQARVREGFVTAVEGSRNPPGDARWLGETLYLAHLGLLLFWLMDRSPDRRATATLRTLAVGFAPWLRRLAATPILGASVRRVVDVVREGIEGPVP